MPKTWVGLPRVFCFSHPLPSPHLVLCEPHLLCFWKRSRSPPRPSTCTASTPLPVAPCYLVDYGRSLLTGLPWPLSMSVHTPQPEGSCNINQIWPLHSLKPSSNFYCVKKKSKPLIRTAVQPPASLLFSHNTFSNLPSIDRPFPSHPLHLLVTRWGYILPLLI